MRGRPSAGVIAMLYVFTSSVGGRITYTDGVGRQILGLLGKRPGPAGVIEHSDIPAALAALERAAADDPPGRASAAGRDGNEERVSIAQRVAPLKELLRQAQAAGKDVTWGL